MGTHGAANTASGPMVTQPVPDVQASVRIPVCCLLPPPAAAATKWADWGSNRRLHECRLAALPLGHYLEYGIWPPCCLGAHLPLTKNPNCVYLSDCLLAGSGTDWLTVNLSSRCTAEGNRISCFKKGEIFPQQNFCRVGSTAKMPMALHTGVGNPTIAKTAPHHCGALHWHSLLHWQYQAKQCRQSLDTVALRPFVTPILTTTVTITTTTGISTVTITTHGATAATNMRIRV